MSHNHLVMRIIKIPIMFQAKEGLLKISSCLMTMRDAKLIRLFLLKKSKSAIIFVQIYVDDIIFGATNDSLCEEFVAAMQGEFEMSMMGKLSFFLGF